MNKAKLKSYAPAARRDFIQAVTDRAHFFGISEKEIVPVEESGDVAIIGGRPFPRAVAAQRRKLDARVKRDGFTQVMEAVAYTWFNRFLALRYMELHGYLEHGFRVLSNTGSSTTPEILDHAAQLDLPGLNKQMVTELKLDGNKDADLYRILLVAQCNDLHSAMPFLFEKIEDETELLLPDNLLHSDSLIRKLVTEIEEEDWQEVEIIGWLYQFYITEKKGQVIGKVVKSEDIPAATQLFTPNWIVKYMVQNSLGRQWVATYPDSPLKSKMEYYIEPASQTDEVKLQLAAITSDSLDPEKLTLLDPASGSGHILVEAYDVFKEIYLERGYSNRDFPRLILEKNLYGLDIDDRAAQMAGFALLMKARKDDRRILRSDNPVKLNVMAFQDSGDISVVHAHWGEYANSISDIVELFSFGKTFGSLIQVPQQLADTLPGVENAVKQMVSDGDLYSSQAARELMPLVNQLKLLLNKYNSVVANPPYMGNNGMNQVIKSFVQKNYPEGKMDLYSAFIVRLIDLTDNSGTVSIMTPFTWLSLVSFEDLRKTILSKNTLSSLIQPEYHSFFDSAFVPICTLTLMKSHVAGYKGKFIDTGDFYGADIQPIKAKEAIDDEMKSWLHILKPDSFLNISGYNIAFNASNKVIEAFNVHKPLSYFGKAVVGLQTGDNNSFLRYWYEVDFSNVSIDSESAEMALISNCRWFPYNKGGAFRKWFGNNELIVDWENDGERIKKLKPSSVIRNPSYYFKPCITWSALTVSDISLRKVTSGFVFDTKGQCYFSNSDNINAVMCFLNSKASKPFLKILAPTMDFNSGAISKIPLFDTSQSSYLTNLANSLVEISQNDWDSSEISWNFQAFSLLNINHKNGDISSSWKNWQSHCSSQAEKMKTLETENNLFFINAYGFQDEITPDVSDEQITLTGADRETDIKRLISYSIGCMMGRFCLEHPGLIYANSGNAGFDQSKYQSFPADDDGIVPVMDMDWYPDDAASRFEEFLKVAWSSDTLEENLKFVANGLSPKGGETYRETIRRYFSSQFYKDHLQTYKRRPIYWLFSSGKQRAFECLVYLHRYNESTLSRMRNEYVTPLQGKFSTQVEYLSNEINAVTSTAERNRLQKQLDSLRKKQVELASFDDLLRHFADQRISLDLNAGVKVNYGKFGNLLAEVKAVTGGTE